MLGEVAAHAHEGRGGAQAGDEVRDARQVPQDLGAGALVVGGLVRGVGVLVEHDPVGPPGGHLAGLGDGGVGAARGRGEHDLGAEGRQQLAALQGGVLGHDAHQAVALAAREHGDGDAGVAGGGLQDGAALGEAALGLGGLDHLGRHAVLDRAGGVGAFELGPQPDVRGRGEARQAHQRRVAEGRGDVGEAGHGGHSPSGRVVGCACSAPRARGARGASRRMTGAGVGRGPTARPYMPPATAGRIVTESPSDSFASRPPMKRTSSSLM